MAIGPFRVWGDIYVVGGPELSHGNDCLVYLVGGDAMVLIDSGAGQGYERIVANIRSLGFDPGKIRAVVATHAHIDHIGALGRFHDEFGAEIVAHELDAEAIETGLGTGAEFYGVDYTPCKVDIILRGAEQVLYYGGWELRAIHIPGHSPGSIAVVIEDEKRILFGQDIHGPYFLRGSNVAQARVSLQRLMDLRADVLCEGHFGIYEPATKVRRYIQGYLRELERG
ncbi:MAG: MBL fold metallo-hydrolase [Chloroflexi bacterium]|nr:MBL fold metallo-hydrolase [Chloroflexota bacterium]